MKVSIISSVIALAAVAGAVPTYQGSQPAGWGSPVNVMKRVPEPILETRGGGFRQGGFNPSGGRSRGKRDEEEVAEPILEARGGGFRQGGFNPSGGRSRGKRDEEEVAEPILEARGGGFRQGGFNPSGGRSRGKRDEEEVAEPILEARGGGFRQGGFNPSGGRSRGKRDEEEVAEPILEARGGGFPQGGFNPSGGRSRSKRGYGGNGAGKPWGWTPPQGFSQDKFPLGGNSQSQQFNGFPQPTERVGAGFQQPQQPANQIGGGNTNQFNVDSQANDRDQGSTLNQPAFNDAAESPKIQLNGGPPEDLAMGTIIPVSSSTGPVRKIEITAGNCLPFIGVANGPSPQLRAEFAFSAGTPFDLDALSSSGNAEGLTNNSGVRLLWCDDQQFDPAVVQALGIRNLQ